MKKYPYLYEIPILYLILFGINQLFAPHHPSFIGIEPNPYWIGILLFSLRYGVVSGLLAGIVAASLYLASAWFFLEHYLFEDFSFYVLPSFFVLAGGLIGAGVYRYRMQLTRFQSDKNVLLKTKEIMDEEIRTLKEVNVGLEKRIVTRMSTLITLYEGAKRLESLNLDELYASSLEFVAKTLGAEELAFYLKSEKGWKLKTHFGWKEYQRRPEEIPFNQGITGLAGGHEKIVSVRDFIGGSAGGSGGSDMPGLVGDAVLAGPVRRGEKGEIIGVLSIQAIPFLNFNSATINLFSFLVNWISRSIGSAVYIDNLKENEIIDPVYQIYSHRYFESRLDQEFLRSKTYFLPLGVGVIEVDGLKDLPKAERQLLLKTLSQIVKQSSREMDVVAANPESNVPFNALWITASPTQVDGMKNKIIERFAMLGEKSIVPRIGVANFSPQTKSAEGLLKEAHKNLEK